jgi:hypothetical protein
MPSVPSTERDEPPTDVTQRAGEDRAPDSTAPEGVPASQQRRSRAMRRAGMAAFAAVVLLGLLNVLGPRLDEATASGGGTTVTITYASVTRPGLSTPWIVEVRRRSGFEGKITVATTGSYFDGFDYNVLYPEPVSTASRGELVVFTFAAPPGETFTVRFDGRATPTWTLYRDAVTVVGGDAFPSVSVAYRTIFLP